MPEPISRRPLQELNLRDSIRSEPHAFLHFLCGEFIAPSGFVRIWQIDERHRRGHKMVDSFEDLPM